MKDSELRPLRIRIGKNAYINGHELLYSNDYEGMEGTIEFCSKCCKENRVQFDGVGNNEKLSNFDILRCELSVTTHPKRWE